MSASGIVGDFNLSNDFDYFINFCYSRALQELLKQKGVTQIQKVKYNKKQHFGKFCCFVDWVFQKNQVEKKLYDEELEVFY